jgi:hypothetical protein
MLMFGLNRKERRGSWRPAAAAPLVVCCGGARLPFYFRLGSVGRGFFRQSYVRSMNTLSEIVLGVYKKWNQMDHLEGLVEGCNRQDQHDD